MNRRLISMCVALLIVLPTLGRAVKAQPATSEVATSLHELFEHLEANNKFLGSVAVSIDGEVVFSESFGESVFGGSGNGKPDETTQYRIGSITKTFTTVMIFQLIEDEQLSLDTKLAEFFPDLPNADQVTIKQMLGHRSGLGSFTDDPNYRSWIGTKHDREMMLERISKQPIKFAPDEKTEYSNTNFILLGFIIEDLTGNAYSDELVTRIAEPLGLDRTAYMTPASAERNVARSFRFNGNRWVAAEQTEPSIPHGAGAIMSTGTDLTRFIEALFAGKLISQDSLDQMSTARGIGLGLFAMPFKNRLALGHNGGIDGFRSSLGYFRDDRVAVAVLGNGMNYPINEILIGVLKIVFEEDYELPSFDAVDVAVERLRRYEGTYAREDFPLKISVRVEDEQLVAQGTGQPAFPLTATSDVEFKFDPAGVVLEFVESKPGSGYDRMNLQQGGATLEFTRE